MQYSRQCVISDNLIECLYKYLNYLEPFSEYKPIDNAINGINQAIRYLNIKKIPEKDLIKNEFIITPLFTNSFVSYYAAYLQNHNCYVIWGLEYAMENIKKSILLNKEQKNIMTNMLGNTVKNLREFKNGDVFRD
ncbi:MAG: hypothetical protein ACYCTB_05600 [bacterium]